MEVISKTFAGVARAGRCGCVCRSTDNTHDGIYNTGYTYLPLRKILPSTMPTTSMIPVK